MSAPAPDGSPAPGRILQLDGLRAVAILLVISHHYFVLVPGLPTDGAIASLHRLLSLSYCGVDLFFVLSGFLIGGVLLDQRAAGNLLPVFYWRRFLRIVPIYALLLAAYSFASWYPAGRLPAAGPVPWGSYLTFTQNLAMASAASMGPYWLSPTWSLANEEQFYLLIPLVVRRLRAWPLLGICGASLVLCPLARIWSWQQGHSFAAVLLTPFRADGLLIGVGCALLLRLPGGRAWLEQRRGLILLVAGALAVVVTWLSWRQEAVASLLMVGLGYSAVGLLAGCCLLLVLLYPAAPPVRLLMTPALVWIGTISYFVYLAHIPVLGLTHVWIRSQPPEHGTVAGVFTTLLALAIVLGAATLSWRLLESRLLALGRRARYRQPAH